MRYSTIVHTHTRAHLNECLVYVSCLTLALPLNGVSVI